MKRCGDCVKTDIEARKQAGKRAPSPHVECCIYRYSVEEAGVRRKLYLFTGLQRFLLTGSLRTRRKKGQLPTRAERTS